MSSRNSNGQEKVIIPIIVVIAKAIQGIYSHRLAWLISRRFCWSSPCIHIGVVNDVMVRGGNGNLEHFIKVGFGDFLQINGWYGGLLECICKCIVNIAEEMIRKEGGN
jgi:hypothetical protein